MTQYAFYFDGKRCTGCKTCVMACKDYKGLSAEVSFRKVYEYGGGTWTTDDAGCPIADVFTYYVSMSCNHCEDPACVAACPTHAMHKDAETGLVSVDADRCIGCGYCHMACPYNAPKVDRAVGHSVKCDGCAERVTAGQAPICVEACPLRALDFGPVDQISKMGEQAAIAPLPQPDHTSPNLFIEPPAAARPVGSQDGFIRNELEVS